MIRSKKTIKLIAIALAIFAATLIPVSTYAEFNEKTYIPPAGNIGSVQDILMKEAKAQLSMKVLSECVGGGVNRNEEWKNVKNISNWFNRSGNDLNVNTGHWYEDQIQGSNSNDDGQIKCGDTGGTDPMSFAAQFIGRTKETLLCDGTPGNGTPSGVAYNKTGKGCGRQESGDGYTRNGNNGGDGATAIPRGSNGMFSNQDWAKFLKRVFDEEAEKEKWEYRFVDVAYYHEMVGYYLYRLEIQHKCGGTSGTPMTEKPADMDMVLTDVTQDGDQAGKVVYKKYNVNSSFSHEFVDNSRVMSCKGMISRANDADMYGKYRDRLVATLNYKCHEDIERRKKAVEDAGGTINEETMAAYNAAKSDTSKYNIGMWIKGDENTGWQCADIGDFDGAHQEDPHGEDPDVDSSEADCYTNAGSLGWILCPIINQVSDAIQGIYTKYITPFLVLDSELFKENSGTYEAWKQFRDMANIVFVIIFIFVIFSQLTGVGIDNYGIKKILPKLIIGAILINLSYIICQLAIDVANIVGYSIGGLFDSIQNGIDYSKLSLSETGGQTLKSIAAPIILIVLIGLICAGAYLAIGPTVLIPVFMAVISVFIAILFCFILLAVRKAFAVLLVAISPLAFACYMLPNTKPLYTKWFNAFKGVLLAFPICSAMIYGGQMVARIIVMAAGNSNMPSTIALSAAVISIIPIFMIPKAISGSMAAISGGIVGLQNRLTGGAKGAIGRSGWAMDKRRETMEMRNRRLAGVNRKGELTGRSKALYDKDSKVGKFRRSRVGRAIPFVGISDSKDQRVAAARSRVLNDMDMRAGESYGDSATYEQAKFDHEVANFRNSADFAALTGNNDAETMGRELTRLMDGSHVSAEDKVKRMALAQAMAGGSGDMKKQLATALRGADGASFKELSKDSGIRAGVGDKDAFVSDALKQANAGKVDKFSDWDNDENRRAVLNNVLDKNNLFSQSGGVIKQAIQQQNEDGSYTVSDSRIQQALSNDNIDVADDVRAAMMARVASSGGGEGAGDASAGGGSEGGGEGGGTPAPAEAGGVVSPAMLTDEDIAYRNKLKEMSERGDSSPDELHIDHSTPPSGGGSGSSTPKPTSNPAGSRTPTGKPRAKEGNKLDYYPRQKGETSAQYGQRLNRQKMIEQKYQSDPPKAGESHADWMKRVGIPPSEPPKA